MFKHNPTQKIDKTDFWMKIFSVCMILSVIIGIACNELAEAIYYENVTDEAYVIWHKRGFYASCFMFIMIYISAFKTFSGTQPAGEFLDYPYIGFLYNRGELRNTFMYIYLRGRLLIILLFIIMYWLIVGRLLFTFRDYQIVFHVYVISNILIIIVGELLRHYYFHKAKSNGCPEEMDMEKVKAIKNMDKIMYILFVVTCLFASFFMYGSISFF